MLKPKKSLGQNFLRSEKAILDIVNSLEDKTLPVIEIGGGEGVVTGELLKNNFKVIVVELDDRAVELLQEKFAKEISENRLEIIHKDVLKTDFSYLISTLFVGEGLGVEPISYNLVGNIPYYITGMILRHIFEQEVLPKQAALMVQKEVAERILARDSKESILSLSIKIYGDVSLVSIVKRGSFVPPPKVDSAIFTIKNIKNPFIDKTQEELFFTIIKTAFRHPRKVALGNLKKYLNGATLLKVEKVLTENACQNKRAEDIPLSVWIRSIN